MEANCWEEDGDGENFPPLRTRPIDVNAGGPSRVAARGLSKFMLIPYSADDLRWCSQTRLVARADLPSSAGVAVTAVVAAGATSG
jgi:hypothetical protein